MDTRETKIYIAILVALAVFMMLVIYFIINIIRDRHALDASYKEKAMGDTNAMDQERARIACDLHDDIGASISSIRLQLECIKPEDPRNPSILGKLVGYLDDVIKNLKRISYNMIPAILQRKGLDAAINELLVMMVPGNMTIEYHYLIKEPAPDKVVHIYRLTQEILNNVMKHSKATLLKIRFSMLNNKIILTIKDDGIGFNVNVVSTLKAGLGLRNISSRAELLHAAVFLETQPGHGAAYQIEIPV